MNILVYGSEGWIGRQICKLLDEMNIKWTQGKIRAENIDELEKEIIKNNPSHIFSFIGRTHGKIDNKEYTTIDYLEQPGKIKENIRDNL